MPQISSARFNNYPGNLSLIQVYWNNFWEILQGLSPEGSLNATPEQGQNLTVTRKESWTFILMLENLAVSWRKSGNWSGGKVLQPHPKHWTSPGTWRQVRSSMAGNVGHGKEDHMRSNFCWYIAWLFCIQKSVWERGTEVLTLIVNKTSRHESQKSCHVLPLVFKHCFNKRGLNPEAQTWYQIYMQRKKREFWTGISGQAVICHW